MNEQILIVDDERDTVELLRYNIKKAGYEPLVAYSGYEALTVVDRYNPLVVLLDVMMPGMNGWETCRTLREGAKGKSLQIIMLSALAEEETRLRGLSLGADDYLTKPFSIKELLLKIQKLVERQQAFAQLRTREQEQDHSLRYVIHEIKNSLTVIGGHSSLARRKNAGQDHFRIIDTTVLHAESLLSDVSLLTRLEREGSPLPTETVDIASEAEAALEMVRPAADDKKLNAAVLKSGSVLVRAHRTAVRQVLVNLLSNAVKYNRLGGTIRLSFSEEQDRIAVTIGDEGFGIPEDELPKIFDKFYRATGSGRIKGAGLGLYIVKVLIDAMGGTVAATSQEGAGSVFTASFPKAGPSGIP